MGMHPNHDDLFGEYPALEPEDARQALDFAASCLDGRIVPLELA